MNLNFLIEHDRHGKIPTRITPYHDREQAERSLLKLDLTQMDELNRQTLDSPPFRME